MAKIVLSIHIPKTAGTSFKRILAQEFGDSLLQVYGKRHPTYERSRLFDLSNKEDLTERGIQVVHGHIRAQRTPLAAACKTVTWVRDPLQRAISHHAHLQRQVKSSNVPHALLSSPEITFEQFMEQPETQNFMSKYLERKNRVEPLVIGVVENFEESIQLFRKQLGWSLDGAGVHVNQNPEKAREYVVGDEVSGRFRNLNMDDFLLYNDALKALCC